MTALTMAMLSFAAIDGPKLDGIDAIMAKAIARNEIPGAVVLVLHDDKVVFRKAYGNRSVEPRVEPMTVDTVFDLASVTKPVATGTCIHKLIDDGKLKLDDPVAKYWPEFGTHGKEKITIAHCLLHTSGLTADNSINDYKDGKDAAMKAIANLKLEAEPGTRFKYSDVGFIVLGEVIAKVSGKSLREYATNSVFEPAKMNVTEFYPKDKLTLPPTGGVAPTGRRDGSIIHEAVHDPRAYAMGGTAGHAGLFSNVDDLTRYCRMLLNGGELDGVRILSKVGVERFTKPQGNRSYGWDVSSSYSGQRGSIFPAGEGFGHTGWTGTSIWVDPPSKTAIIILANRVHPNDKGNASPVRREIATLVASAIPGIEARKKPVKTGLDVLKEKQFASLKGKKVGLVTNHTGRTADGESIIDAMRAANVDIVALFSPEHGIRGEKDEKIGDSKDEKTGLPIYSLYGEHRKPTAEMLKGVDTLVYDIQDIGCRFYTYISTLGLILEAAAENKLDVIVLDRPNPIGGVAIEGHLRDAGSNFVGFHSLPVRHGLTVGELAKMFNTERKTNAKLTVIPCENWIRSETFDRTNQPWRNPSPNMRHFTAAMLYPGVGLLETTNISVGRGTERPFEWIGAPWMDGRKLANALNASGVKGVRFVPCRRTPSSSVHKEKDCDGVDIIVTDLSELKPVELGLTIATTLKTLFPAWETKRLNTLLLHQATLDAIANGKDVPSSKADEESFRERRRKFLLYSE